MARKRFKNVNVNVIPKGLRFFEGEGKLKPKEIKAVVNDFCEKRQQQIDKQLLEQIPKFPLIDENDPGSFPHVGGVNYKSEPIDLVDWLTQVKEARLFEDNNLIRRNSLLNLETLSNHQLWQKVSEIMIAEFHFSCEKPESYKPRIDKLIFRDKKDFYEIGRAHV